MTKYVDPAQAAAREARDFDTRQNLFTGAVLGGVLALTAALVSDVLYWIATLTLPALGAWLAWALGPEAQAIKVDQFERAKERDEQKHKDKEYEDGRRLLRIKEALYWWTTEGRKIHQKDDSYFRDLVRLRYRTELDVFPTGEAIIAAYHNENDLCANRLKAADLARWSIANHSDRLADELTPEDRTADRLTDILRLHHGRDVLLFREAKAIYEAEHFPKVRPPEPWHIRFAHVLEREHSLLVARTEARARIEQEAQARPEDERAQYVRDMTQLLDELYVQELKRLAGSENDGFKKSPTYESGAE